MIVQAVAPLLYLALVFLALSRLVGDNWGRTLLGCLAFACGAAVIISIPWWW
jgi:hypothetical protein